MKTTLAPIQEIENALRQEVYETLAHSSNKNPSIAQEPEVAYGNVLNNKLMMIQLIKAGVSYKLFKLIQKISPFTEENWAEILDLSTKSLQRYKQSAKAFKSLQSEKILEIAEVTTYGIDVFGSTEKFKLWLETPSFALSNLKPIDLIKDSYGKEIVLGELTRINYGILA